MEARDEQGVLYERQVVGRKCGHGAGFHRRLEIDGAELRMRVRAAHERSVNHPVKMDVVDETAMAGQQPAIFDPQQWYRLFCHATSSLTQSDRQTAASLRR